MGNMARYKPLQHHNLTINRWLVSQTIESRVRFDPVTMDGSINTWLLEGFAIHENPCRQQFVTERRAHSPELPHGLEEALPGNTLAEAGALGTWNLYFPWGNPRVERSNFWMVPTHLLTYAVTQIDCPRAHLSKLKLITCGSITLWINGEKTADFTPFTRNKEAETEIEVEWKAGINTVVVCFEDLAERDTQYYFRVDYEGTEPLDILLPIGEVKEEEAHSLEKALAEAYFTKDTVTNGPVVLNISNPLDEKIDFRMQFGSDIFGSLQSADAVLQAGAAELKLGQAEQFGMGYKYIQLSACKGSLSMMRRLGVQIYPQSALEFAVDGDIAARKEAALKTIAKYGEPNLHTALALLKTGGSTAEAEAILREEMEAINARADCSDFFLVSLFRVWQDYRSSGLFTESFWNEVKACILNFRYWMDEPGDDVMWFFSENHALLFHTCELLAGQLFPEGHFTNSNETGAQHKAKAEARLKEWFERFLTEGLAEWNSSAYFPIDAIGFIQLYDMAESAEIRKQAKEALDLLYYYMAVNSHLGVLASTYGRSYEKELKGHYIEGTSSMSWIGYGVGYLNNYTISNVALCLSDYVPPEEYKAYLLPKDKERFVFRFDQGLGGYAKLYNYKTKRYSLSSIADFKIGQRGYQEHVMHLTFGPEANLWVNHPGELAVHGSGRPSYWAGNGYLPKVGQYKGLGVLLYRIDPAHDVHYTHAYFPTEIFDEYAVHNGWYFARIGDSYAAVYAVKGLRLQDQGPDRGKELLSSGLTNGWVLRVSDGEESGSFEQFMERISGMEVSLEGSEQLALTDPDYGSVELHWNKPLVVNGEEQPVGGFGIRGKLEYV
ncbi:hypothetical protein [Paenibacillus sp. J2TS4]|uniref:hypothetical protein n=1 Tax=Paenibacillus sp. J2TS4 TaxID=2807194 RepID=UPI001B03A17E|nr:hypothetical protein [Paenibacillus sp. J2TS4]GIP31456.1 hypothetical protein J2TS4_06660 [Paenibacillus sp. J2TS4]